MMKVNRIPNNDVYNVFLTFVIALTILIIIYASVPQKHSCIYFSKK